jgi:polysaccharide deacetylase 2 family uncharacterized protein YibQ
VTTDLTDGFDEPTEPRSSSRSRLLAVARSVQTPWLRSWRPLTRVWGAFIGTFGVVALVLQLLGPPAPRLAATGGKPQGPARPAPQVAATAQPSSGATAKAGNETRSAATAPVLPPVAVVLPQALPASRPPGSVAPPDPLLLQPSQIYPGTQLPRIGANRLSPMKAYASPFNMNDPRPRVAILIAGFGMNEQESLAAIRALPPQVSIAVSPYSFKPEKMLAAARDSGHEYLVSLPMEPLGYPLNDPGDRAMLTGASQAINAQRLEWALSRFQGYVGATGALGALRGERFGAAIDQMAPVLDRLADLGLLYVDPRPNGDHLVGSPAQRGVGRAVDVVLDDPPGRDEIDRKLAQLEQAARDHAGAIGLAGRPSPVTVDRIAAWAATLAAHGLTLAPVSVVVQMPHTQISTSSVAVRTNLFQ